MSWHPWRRRARPGGRSLIPLSRQYRHRSILPHPPLQQHLFLSYPRLRWLPLLPLLHNPLFPPPDRNRHVEGVIGPPEHINPILAQNEVDRDLVALMFNGLTKVNEQFQIVPDLAYRWQVSADGRTYTFDLRRDVLWHDGVPFTADDVVFTVRAIQEQYYQGSAQLANLWRTAQVEKVHTYSVRVVLAEPFAPCLDYTTIGILPAHLLADVPPAFLPQQPFNLMPVGTGPYKMSEMHLERGYLMLEANSAYFGPTPLVEEVEFQFYPNRASILAAYDQGAVTGIGGAACAGTGRCQGTFLVDVVQRAAVERDFHIPQYCPSLGRLPRRSRGAASVAVGPGQTDVD